jgi:hypothetical protein
MGNSPKKTSLAIFASWAIKDRNMKAWTLLAIMTIAGAAASGGRSVQSARAAGKAEQVLTLKKAQMAGLAGFRNAWNESFHTGEGEKGQLVFDAIHRSALVRFPDAAEKIAARVQKGFAVEKVLLVLPYQGTEIVPPGNPDFPVPNGYVFRANWGVGADWRRAEPRWHAVAWALRRPWDSSGKFAPTYNAFIQGAGYWTKFAAQDEKKDRFPHRFGPTEVSSTKPEERMDVTATLTDSTYGATFKDRLRAFADHGFLLKKWETYDHRYFREVYEWGTATGGRAIRVAGPRLVVTFSSTSSPETVEGLARPVKVKELAAKLKKDRTGGKPTAVLPSPAQINAWAKEAATRPAWMPEWQWERVQQLTSLTSDRRAKPFWYQFVPPSLLKNRLGRPGLDPISRRPTRVFSDLDVYAAWVDTVLSRQPRGWDGFSMAQEMIQIYAYSHALPAPAQDHFRTLWEAWLMPDRPTKELVHPMKDKLDKKNIKAPDFIDSYYKKTGDWRGNKSFYRAGFNYTMSTQNFNNTAAAGALLGGALVKGDYPMRDGRHGLETFPLRLWAWSEGISQENIDHYYFPITLSDQKTVADFGPTVYDRLLGASLIAKSMEEITSAYHPRLRRFTAGSTRTMLNYMLATQDGLQYIMHTLAPNGALHDLPGRLVAGGIPVVGHEVPAERIAQQSRLSPWAPAWMMNKPDGYQERSSYDRGRNWQTIYQGRHYGLASRSRGWSRVQVMAHWRRDKATAGNVDEIKLLDMRPGFNRTQFADQASGHIHHYGQQAVLQHRNKMIVAVQPASSDWLKEEGAVTGIASLQASIALFNFQPEPTWRLYVDGKHVTRLPHRCKQGSRITLHDGVTYLGILPLRATDLGRNEEVVLREGDTQMYNKMTYRPALLIESYFMKRDKARKLEKDFWRIFPKTKGGFVLEMGDASEFDDFAAFRKHFDNVKCAAEWNEGKTRIDVTYSSDKDSIKGTIDAQKFPLAFTDATINGQPFYPAKGIQRDTSLGQQGKSGRLTKNGATLTTDLGVVTYLRTDPKSGHYMAWNPTPTPTKLEFSAPDGVTIRADGKLGLAKLVVRPKDKTLWIDEAPKPGQEDLAESILVAGLGDEPQVVLNGKALKTNLSVKTLNGKTYQVVPLPK